jgi:hypothetical protein
MKRPLTPNEVRREMFNKGDRALCIDNRYVERDLTIGKKYTVLESSGFGTIRISCDSGVKEWFNETRFSSGEAARNCLVKFTVTLENEQVDALERLGQLIGSGSMEETIVRALKLYGVVVENDGVNKTLSIKGANHDG